MSDLNELPRASTGIRLDVRGNRDLIFNNWHRDNCSRPCYVTDVDFLEYRFEKNKLILKAIFETKEWHVTEPKYIEDCANFKAIALLATNAKIPFYFVWYLKDNNSVTKFKLWNVFNEAKKDAKEITPKEFKDFIEHL